ncbi:MAG TPA: hypothetical protein VE715_02850 [Blastocatellia bacterium]|nr:hypothetical protein [Blastocatellia bacterium]
MSGGTELMTGGTGLIIDGTGPTDIGDGIGVMTEQGSIIVGVIIPHIAAIWTGSVWAVISGLIGSRLCAAG